uniref:C2H2-type domain-containing protein n=1 Tax=Anopheles dirus TaxID=7168 RepID=A0A182NQZ6_9DIPT
MAPAVDITLHLECWREELSSAQKSAYEKAEKEHNEIRSKLKEIVQDTGGKNIYSGQVFTAYQVLGPVPGLEQISQPLSSLTKRKHPPALAPLYSPSPKMAIGAASPEPSPSGRRGRGRRSELPIEDDPPVESVVDIASDDVDEDYIPLSKRMKAKDKNFKESPAQKKVREEKVKTPELKTKGPKSPASTSKVAAISVRPTEFNSIGGLQVGADKDKKRATAEPTAVVDLTKDDGSKPSADSREISFSKIQGKTFPSLVVLARPSLRVTEKATSDRPQLDAKVKNVLVHPAPKFTEWLIQQGLIKSEQTCQIHNDKLLKLGMYSDTSKFPYSGGYFWISDCCPTRFTSVFHGSLFEGSPHPPSVILKLIYHWACQTNISNVVNWVKVDNMYLKGLYTLLRSACTLALCRHMKLLGGQRKPIEIGVISLGTTTQDGQQRQVKVEVLGVLDPEAKILRLRAVEPLLDGDRSYKKRFSKILEPLSDWVDKDSTILTDLTVDKGTLNSMGYKTVIQVSPAESSGKNSNANIMDYLRRIVPRMFQNTLSLLSRQIIQQFLNELVWREMYGNSPGSTFDNIVKHLSEEAKIETRDSLVTRLHKAAADPFKHWNIVSDVPSLAKTPGKRGRKPKDFSLDESTPTPSVARATATASPTEPQPPKKIILKKVKKEEDQRAASVAAAPPTPALVSESQKKNALGNKKETTVALEAYYYGCTGGGEVKESALPCSDFLVACPECPGMILRSNLHLLDHLLWHANPPPPEYAVRPTQCRTCLEYVPDRASLKDHRTCVHPMESKSTFAKTCNCLICEQRFSTLAVLSVHMQKSHHQLEMPYRCAGCNFRSSILHTVVEHFYEKHKGSGLLQCPFCLKMVCVYRDVPDTVTNSDQSGALVKNVAHFLSHLRRHMDKTSAKRCNKCALSFFTKGEHKFHTTFDHVANRAEPSVLAIVEPSVQIERPKKKVTIQKDSTMYRIIKPWNKVILNTQNGCICLECGNDFEQFNHMIGRVKCLKCPYQTDCLRSMLNHVVSCSPLALAPADQYPKAMMSQEMHCKCGFSSFDGYALARHLVACGRFGAVYTSVEAAQANVTERSMLDMLGLVRRDEDEESAIGGPLAAAADDTQEDNELLETTTLSETFAHEETVGDSQPDALNEPSVSGVAYDPSQSLYNIAGAGEQQFTTQLSFDDLGPPSVLPAQDNDRTPQLKDDYQSLATPRVPDQQDY